MKQIVFILITLRTIRYTKDILKISALKKIFERLYFLN